MLWAAFMRLQQQDLVAYRHECTIAALLAPWVKDQRAPDVPASLRDNDG